MKKFQVLIFIVANVLVLAISIISVKASIPEVLKTLITGSLGSAAAIRGTLKEMTPLLLLGCSVYIALKAGLFNIGAEGQFVMGALFGAVTMLGIGGPVGMILGCVVGAVVGGAWAFPAGWIKAFRNGHEVITTIMLNNIAINLTKALVAGPFMGKGQQYPSTSMLTPDTQLTPLIKIGNFEVGQSFVVGILVTVGLAYWLKKTVAGYELRATGANATAAQFAGVETKKVTMKAMFVSGAIAGLAGALQVAQFDYRFTEGTASGYGFDALGVALLAGGNPVALIASSFFFGMLNKGGATLLQLSVDKGITTVILSIVILVFAVVSASRKKVANG
jgi:simple sugar transport system permease protein